MGRSLAFALILVAFLALTGCEKRIDASSKENFDQSCEEITKSLEPAKQEEFQAAVTALMMKRVVFSGSIGDQEAMKKKLKETFDGKTASEVIEDGKKARAESEADMKKLTEGK